MKLFSYVSIYIATCGFYPFALCNFIGLLSSVYNEIDLLECNEISTLHLNGCH